MSRILEAQDIYLPALCVWREMRGEIGLARLACYWTILNRTSDPHKRWPTRPSEVVLQRYQYSSFNANDPNAYLFPGGVNGPDIKAWAEICAMLEALAPDPTNGAVYYEALPPGALKAAWFNPSNITLVVGHTRFYRG